MCKVERFKNVGAVVRTPQAMVWAVASVVVLGVKPWMLSKIQELLGQVPVSVVVGAFVLAAVYLLVLPARKRAQFKDLWEGGDSRLQARNALTELKEAILSQTEKASREKLTYALVAYTLATALFHSDQYEESLKTASDAQTGLGVSIAPN
jgi:hypothetical protein